MAIDYWCKCKNCKYVDPTVRDSYRWWCEWYHQYVDPDEVRECRNHKER